MKIVFTVVSFLTASLAFSQEYDSLKGPRLWLRADQSDLTAGKWTDIGFFKNHATPLNSAGMPAEYSSINFNKAVVFDGIDDHLKIPVSFEGTAELSVFTVFHSADTVERAVWGTQQSLSRPVFLTTRRALGPNSSLDLYGKHEKLAVMNSLVQNWDQAPGAPATAFITLSKTDPGTPYKLFQGKIGEIIIFNRALPFLERIQYETYLAIKYGTGLKEGNAVSSKEKLLWNVEQNAAFGKHLAGIGRDDFFKLHQRQSASAYDSGLLIMSAGTMAPNNADNSVQLKDQDFILWGDNGLPLSTRPGLGKDSLLSYVQRRWLVTASGITANKIATELQIDASKFGAEPLGYWLVIDRSGQGNFSIDNLEYVFPEKVAGGKIIYKNVTWDTDGSGKDNFGFVRARNLLAVVRKIKDPSCTDENAGKVKIEVIAGKAPYQYSLRNSDASIKRDWKQTTASVDQGDLTKGDYTLTFSDASKESLSRKFKMIMPDALAIELGQDRKLSAVDPIVLDVSSQVPDSVAVTYRWENSFGYSSTDAKITVAETGVYRVFVTKLSDGCVFSDALAITGAESQRIAVYPTILQATDPYNISVSMDRPGTVAVKVFNSRGILTESLEGRDNSEYQFITQIKESGLYVVTIQTPRGLETRKIIVY